MSDSYITDSMKREDARKTAELERAFANVDALPAGNQGGAIDDGRADVFGEPIPDPEPLPMLPSVPDFPIGVLPKDLRGWVKDAADRARFRPDFAAVAIMSALGSVIGRKLGIRLKQFDDWTEYANVWGVLVGSPSSLKSPAMRDAMRPFKALQVRADEANEAERKDYEADVTAFKLRKEGRKKAAVKALTKDPNATIDLGGDAAPDEPIARTYWTSDVNEASLGVLLKNNPNGVLIERDELSALLSGLEDDSRADLRGMLLSGWSGKEGYRFDRIMRGTIYIPKFAVSMVGGIQPGPLARYVRGAATGERADGLLQRFQLLVWPDPAEFQYVDRRPDPSAKAAAMAVFERADALDGSVIGMTDEHGDEPPFVRLSSDAQALFIEWYTAFMRERREAEASGGDGPLASHFGKYPGLVAKLALITHVADEPDAREVSKQTLMKALAWLAYLTPHAIRAYHAAASPESSAAELLLARVKRGELPPKFGPRDVYRKCWKGLDDSAGVKKACQLLHDYGWLIEVDQAERKFGRPSDPVYSVSPKVEVAS
jgi:hypothetical protein